MDLAITNVPALTMRGDGIGALEDATLGIDGGELVYVGPSDGIDASDAAEIVDDVDDVYL